MSKKETRIVYFQIIDGTQEDVKNLGKALSVIKDKVPFDIEFLVGNEKIELKSLDFLLNELLKLYKMKKKLMEKYKNVKKEE